MLQIKTIKTGSYTASRAYSHRKLLYNLWKNCYKKKSWYTIERRIMSVLNQLSPESSNKLRSYGTCCLSKSATTPLFNKLSYDVKMLCDVQKRLFSTTSKFYNEQGDKRGKNDDNQMSTLIAKAVLWMLTAYMLVGFISIFFPASNQPEVVRYVSWNEFVYQMLANGEVEEIIVRPDVEVVTIILHEGAVLKGKKAEARTYHMNIGDINRFEEKLREAERSLGIMQGNGIPVVYERSSDTAGKLLFTLGLAAVLIFFLSKSKGMKFPISMDGMSQFTKAKFTIIDPLLGGSKGVKFSDVAGLQEAKQEVIEFVDYLKKPERYKSLGAKVPRGALLLGPPGCGKTLLAKAVASEANVPFLTMNGSEFIEMIGGLGAARVRSLFKEARKRAPCIVYIDEIDAIGKSRNTSSSQVDGMSGEGEQTLNQLLVEMDGMSTKEEVIMLASTNRADVLDKALMRPGRFDRLIYIDYPNFIEREEIFRHHLKSIVLEKEPKTYSSRLAKLTPGFSGADIANICNESALHAARVKKKRVDASDLEYAIERVVAGVEKKTQVMNLQEKRVVAYHESGHALLGWLLEHTDVLLKVTILPRTNQALGFAQYTPSDQKLYSKEQLFERMVMALGGRAAEAITFNRITTGAANDLDKVTKMAYAQVRTYGLNDKVGHLSFSEQDLQQAGRRPYSKQLANLIDFEARALIAQAYQMAEKTLTENEELLIKLAEALLVKETLNYDDVVELLGPLRYPNKNLVDQLEFESELNQAGPPPLPGLKQKYDQSTEFRRVSPGVIS